MLVVFLSQQSLLCIKTLHPFLHRLCQGYTVLLLLLGSLYHTLEDISHLASGEDVFLSKDSLHELANRIRCHSS